MSWYREWRPYVSVGQRRANAAKYALKLAKKEKRELSPVKIDGRKIAVSFWGQAWCDNLESYSDFANRLPRGRTYVRNGSVIDLQIARGEVKAIVSGSEIYTVKISIKTLDRKCWGHIQRQCAQSVASLIDLLQGRFDQAIMQRLSQRDDGLFPQPKEIELSCSCPDWAGMCKHVAATLYGVGARLDTQPELLFTLRDVDHLELIGTAVSAENLDRALTGEQAETLAGDDLEEMFGIELDGAGKKKTPSRRRKSTATVSANTSHAKISSAKTSARKGRAAKTKRAKVAAKASALKPADKSVTTLQPPAKLKRSRKAR